MNETFFESAEKTLWPYQKCYSLEEICYLEKIDLIFIK